MINSKNILVLGLPYLIFVCSLYHLTYYGLFGLNGLNVISTGDIIKSAIYPLILTFGASAIGVFFGHMIYNSIIKRGSSDDLEPPGRKEIVFKFLFLIILNAIFVTISFFILGEINLLLIAFAIGNVVFGVLNSDRIINSDLSIYINKDYLLAILIYLPFFSISTAIQDADNIISNRSFKFSTFTNINNEISEVGIDTLKLIGSSEQTFIFTDLKNKKIYFVKSDRLILESK